MASDIQLPDQDHPITIDADTRRVIARAGDTLVADTTAALTLREAGYPPVHYIPLDDVVPGTLHPSSTRSHCPYKGDASYYDVVLPDGQRVVDAVWTYPTPHPAMDAIAHHVAFYPDRVQVIAEPPSEPMPTVPDLKEVTDVVLTTQAADATTTVADLMRAAVVSVERDAHLAAVAYLMRQAGETALVVVNDTEQRTPLAVITDTDVAQAIADGRDPNQMRVNELLHRDPITVSPDTPIVRAAAVMVAADIRHLPVVAAEGRLLGMVDISDACRALVDSQAQPEGSSPATD